MLLDAGANAGETLLTLTNRDLLNLSPRLVAKRKPI